MEEFLNDKGLSGAVNYQKQAGSGNSHRQQSQNGLTFRDL